jgi:hypothetical protein
VVLGPLSIADFENALDHHGADLTQWPADTRRDAEQLLGASEDARRLHAAAQAMEAALRAPQAAPAGLADRIVSAATRSERKRR